MVGIDRDLEIPPGPTPSSIRVTYSRMSRALSSWVLSICKHEVIATSLSNLCHCLTTITVKNVLFLCTDHGDIGKQDACMEQAEVLHAPDR